MEYNKELNADLYKKMYDEQETYRDWLLSLPPERILNHAYEYATRQDILFSVECNDLTDNQAKALLKSPCPLADVFKDFEKQESNQMEDIWHSVESRADDIIKRSLQKKHLER